MDVQVYIYIFIYVYRRSFLMGLSVKPGCHLFEVMVWVATSALSGADSEARTVGFADFRGHRRCHVWHGEARHCLCAGCVPATVMPIGCFSFKNSSKIIMKIMKHWSLVGLVIPLYPPPKKCRNRLTRKNIYGSFSGIHRIFSVLLCVIALYKRSILGIYAISIYVDQMTRSRMIHVGTLI